MANGLAPAPPNRRTIQHRENEIIAHMMHPQHFALFEYARLLHCKRHIQYLANIIVGETATCHSPCVSTVTLDFSMIPAGNSLSNRPG